MKNISVSWGQSLVDVAVWQYGSVEGLFDVARLNGFRITDELQAGMTMQVEPEKAYRTDVVAFFEQQKYVVNTGAQMSEIPPPFGDFNDDFGSDFNI